MHPKPIWYRSLPEFLLLLLLCILPPASAAQKKPTPPQPRSDIVSLSERAKRSVAIIRQQGRDGKQEGIGSGVIIDANGLIATCLHVIGEGRGISIELADGRKFDVTEVHASDRKLDLAILRINARSLPALRLGDATKLKQGESVVAMGNPAGLEHSVVQGVVSARRDFDGVELIQLAIPIEPGNSGGPLLDLTGRVQGLLNMKSAVTANLGFAIPVNALQRLLETPNPIPISRWLNLGALNEAEWKPLMGASWRRRAGRILVENPGTGFGGRSLCLWQQSTPELPLDISVTVKLEDESGAAGLAFLSDGGSRHYGFYPTAGQLRLTRFEGPDVFSWTILKDVKTSHYKPGEWNTIRVRVETNRITGFVNGTQVLEMAGPEWTTGRVGLAKFRDTRAEFKHFRIGSIAPQNIPAETSQSISNAIRLAIDSGQGEADLLAGAETNGAAARTILLEQARKLDADAQKMRRLASALSERTVQNSLAAALDKPEEEIDLFHAALLVAKLDNPDLEVEAYRTEMRNMAAEFKLSLQPGDGGSRRVAALSRFLFLDQGFHGSRADFYNRANSYINQVIEDREGIPITLAVIYLELARQTGITNLTGIPVPTRFMVRHQKESGPEELIDVFDGGKVLNRNQAVELVADNVDAINERDFQPARKRDIIARMLHNLLGIAQRTGSIDDAIRYLDTLLVLNPGSASDRFNRARYHMQRGDRAAARADVRWLLENDPPGIDLRRLRELYESL